MPSCACGPILHWFLPSLLSCLTCPWLKTHASSLGTCMLPGLQATCSQASAVKDVFSQVIILSRSYLVLIYSHKCFYCGTGRKPQVSEVGLRDRKLGCNLEKKILDSDGGSDLSTYMGERQTQRMMGNCVAQASLNLTVQSKLIQNLRSSALALMCLGDGVHHQVKNSFLLTILRIKPMAWCLLSYYLLPGYSYSSFCQILVAVQIVHFSLVIL